MVDHRDDAVGQRGEGSLEQQYGQGHDNDTYESADHDVVDEVFMREHPPGRCDESQRHRYDPEPARSDDHSQGETERDHGVVRGKRPVIEGRTFRTGHIEVARARLSDEHLEDFAEQIGEYRTRTGRGKRGQGSGPAAYHGQNDEYCAKNAESNDAQLGGQIGEFKDTGGIGSGRCRDGVIHSRRLEAEAWSADPLMVGNHPTKVGLMTAP